MDRLKIVETIVSDSSEHNKKRIESELHKIFVKYI